MVRHLTSRLRVLTAVAEPGYILLIAVVSVLVGVTGSLMNERAMLRRVAYDLRPGIAGGHRLKPGDLLPAFVSEALDAKPSAVGFGPSRQLFIVIAPSCAVCVDQAPLFAELARFADTKKVAVRWISIGSRESSARFAGLLSERPEMILMESQALIRAYRVVSTPQLVVVGPTASPWAGEVEWAHNGFLDVEGEQDLKAALEATPRVLAGSK